MGVKRPKGPGEPAGEYAGCSAELPCSVDWLHDSAAAYSPWTEASWDAAVM